MKLAQAFGGLGTAIRTRSFELNGHTFKVKVPLTSELEAMQERIKEPCKETADKYFAELTKTVYEKKEEFEKVDKVVFKDDDILIDGKSMREIAQQKAVSEKQTVELFKLLIPEDDQFDMSDLTYKMIDELFPFSIQLEIIEQISKAISPEYKDTRGK